MKHCNFIFPQWQGNTETSPLYGAKEFMGLYLHNKPTCFVEVDEFENLFDEAGITARKDIVRQLKSGFSLLEEERPETVFTLGGGCDAGVVPAAYLNARYQSDLCLVWFDAHADLNTPQTSPSGMFCGMPLRALMGEGDSEIVNMLPQAFTPEQTVMAGVRITDQAEANFIAKHSIPVIEVNDLNRELPSLVEAVRNTGRANVCIHIDLDVLDPTHFPNTPFKQPEGIWPSALLFQVRALCEEFKVKGLGIFEYAENGGIVHPWMKELVSIGLNL